MNKIWLIPLVIFSLITGCENTSRGAPDDNTPENNQSTLIEGGTINNPTKLQFEVAYNMPESHKTYVKVSVNKFQRIIFDLSADYRRAWYFAPAITLLDASHNVIHEFMLGETNSYWGALSKSVDDTNHATQDIIFLKDGEYIIEFQFAPNSNNGYGRASSSTVTAHDLGIYQLKSIVNGNTYNSKKCYFDIYNDNCEYHTFLKLDLIQNGDINLHGYKKSDGNYDIFRSAIYDYDLNIMENFDSVGDINITLSQGKYLFHPTNDDCTITFLNP